MAQITLNRPEVYNALNQAMVDELHDALDGLRNANLGALVIDAAGEKAFLSGADIGELRHRGKADAARQINSRLFRAIEMMPMPTIAAVRGYALGGGCELAMACDMRIAGRGARFGQPEVSLGIMPAAGATYRLPRLVGAGIARELIFSGRVIDAAEALRIGLVNRVVNDDEVTSVALQLAEEIGKNSSAAIRCAKQALLAAPFLDTDAAMTLESSLQAHLFDSSDKAERMDAFLEHRHRSAGTEKDI